MKRYPTDFHFWLSFLNDSYSPVFVQDIDIIVTYTDTSGSVRIRTVKSRDLSASWIWRSPTDENTDHQNSSQVVTSLWSFKLVRKTTVFSP